MGLKTAIFTVEIQTDAILVNYRNLKTQEKDFVGGYTTFMSCSRPKYDGSETIAGTDGIGAAYKDAVTEPGGWRMYMYSQGETAPKKSNHVSLSGDKKDEWGIPQLVTNVDYDSNDEVLLKDILTQGAEMLDKAVCKEY